MSRIVDVLARHAPYLGPPKRWATAVIDGIRPTKRTYAQHGEDQWFAERWPPKSADAISYIDVGANHPMRISNTYLMYRNGYRGVVVEPDLGLLALHRRFRPRDVCIGAACGEKPGVAKFNISVAPVASSLGDLKGDDLLRTEYVPIVTLNQVAAALSIKDLFLLSVDTEGFDVDVLRGASELLPKTQYVCVEVWDDDSRKQVSAVLSPTHDDVTTLGCNVIFARKA